MSPIAKGEDWGRSGSLPPDSPIVSNNTELRTVVAEHRRAGRSGTRLTVGILGGDLATTLGVTGPPTPPEELRSREGMLLPVDLGSALIDGSLHLFVAHLVARRSWAYGPVLVAMNGQWHRTWNLGPRAHPNDGMLDVYEGNLSLGDRLRARSRLPTGSHVPHPKISYQRTASFQREFARSTPVYLDGELVKSARTLSVRIEPDAFDVMV